MIEKIFEINEKGITIPIRLDEFYYDPYRDIDNDTYNKFHDGSKKGIKWILGKNEIKIFDKNVSIKGRPTIDMNYIVAVYQGLDGEFKPPNNAVIYNLDGTIHKILEIPILISDKIVAQIEKNKQSNPPIELAKFKYGLGFRGFGWHKDKEGKICNTIYIEYDQYFTEGRELDPVTGELGKLLSSRYNYH